MDFELSDEHRMLKDSIANFAEKELKPIAETIDREDHKRGRYACGQRIF